MFLPPSVNLWAPSAKPVPFQLWFWSWVGRYLWDILLTYFTSHNPPPLVCHVSTASYIFLWLTCSLYLSSGPLSCVMDDIVLAEVSFLNPLTDSSLGRSWWPLLDSYCLPLPFESRFTNAYTLFSDIITDELHSKEMSQQCERKWWFQ